MKITSVEMLHVDAGWRPWSFVKVTTDAGIIGWSEATDSHGSPHGQEGVVFDLAPLLVGRDPGQIELLLFFMHSRTRQSPGSVVQKAIGAIENALWDIKGKTLGVPVYTLFGGPVRTKLPLYWSHCGTSRVRAYDLIRKPQIKTTEDLLEFGKEVRASGFKNLKTNIGIFGEKPYVYMPGFYKSEGDPAMNPDPDILRHIDTWVGTMRQAVGDDIGIALDLNYNFKPEGYIRIGRMLEKYHLAWLEIDTPDPGALRTIKESINIPITSCENLYGARQYRPFFERYAMDNVSVDVLWNGFGGSKKIADMADIHEMNVGPHNYNGHLSTFISAQFCALIPNMRIMEIDVDDVPWREELFTATPNISNGHMLISDAPGWGCDVNESVLREHPWPKSS